MEKYKKGGYTILDLESSTIYADSVKALDSNKPVVVYDTNKPYFADTIVLDGDDNVVITKGGKTITIANDNTITSEGNIDDVIKVYNQLNGSKVYDDFYAIDGDIEISGLPTGLYCYYAHARVSNGKLNVTIAFRSENGEAISAIGSTQIGGFKLPAEVLAKLIPYAAVNLSTKYGNITSASWQASGKTVLQILKDTDGIKINLTQEAVGTVSSTGDLRFEFNYLL